MAETGVALLSRTPLCPANGVPGRGVAVPDTVPVPAVVTGTDCGEKGHRRPQKGRRRRRKVERRGHASRRPTFV